jgi:hypothetical protein
MTRSHRRIDTASIHKPLAAARGWDQLRSRGTTRAKEKTMRRKSGDGGSGFMEGTRDIGDGGSAFIHGGGSAGMVRDTMIGDGGGCIGDGGTTFISGTQEV